MKGRAIADDRPPRAGPSLADRIFSGKGEMGGLIRAVDWSKTRSVRPSGRRPVAIVREKIKPERDVNNREVRKRYWWRCGELAQPKHKPGIRMVREIGDTRLDLRHDLLESSPPSFL